MGFFDLFKPKWEHSNANVRKAAVEKLIDQRILEKIAENDDDEDVRKAANIKIKDHRTAIELYFHRIWRNTGRQPSKDEMMSDIIKFRCVDEAEIRALSGFDETNSNNFLNKN